MESNMKRIALLIIVVFTSLTTTLASDSLYFTASEKRVVENISPAVGNEYSADKSDNSKEWIFAVASLLFALIIAGGQVVSSFYMTKSTIDTNNSAKLREENEKLEERCDSLMKQLFFMYKVEDIALLKDLEGKFEDTNAEGLTEQDKERIIKKNNKAAIQLKKQTRFEAEEIVGYRFNSNYSRRNILYRSKRTQLDKKSVEAKQYNLYEDIE